MYGVYAKSLANDNIAAVNRISSRNWSPNRTIGAVLIEEDARGHVTELRDKNDQVNNQYTSLRSVAKRHLSNGAS